MRLPLPFLVLFAAAVLAALFLEPPSAAKAGALQNAVILIVRHAEKPAEGDGLSPAGQARASAYAGYFKNYQIAGQPLKLDSLFASADSKESDRPRLTLGPTSALLGLAIDGRFADLQFQQLADALRARPPGQHTLVCWHHGEIPQLLRALGADPAQVLGRANWPDTVFNWVIQLRYDANGRLLEAKRITENF